jgi:hypothetical protein
VPLSSKGVLVERKVESPEQLQVHDSSNVRLASDPGTDPFHSPMENDPVPISASWTCWRFTLAAPVKENPVATAWP